MTGVDFTPLGVAEKGNSFLEVAKRTFRENRKSTFPYIVDMGVESGPLTFLVGHATELFLKAIIQASGTSERRLRQFRGFAYLEPEPEKPLRRPKKSPRAHNLEFLFRLSRRATGGEAFDNALDERLGSHRYFREDHVIFTEPVERPNHEDYFQHLRMLNANFDRPFPARYFQRGVRTLPDTELLLVGAEFLKLTFDRNFVSLCKTRGRKGDE